MTKNVYYLADKVVQSVKKNRGVVSKIADDLNVTTQTVYNYRNRYKTVEDALADQKNRRDDFVETKLWQMIRDNNITAIIFYAKTQMKHRGYVERQEVTGADGGKVDINITWAEDSDG